MSCIERMCHALPYLGKHPSNYQQNRTCNNNPIKQAHIIKSAMYSNHGRIHALHHQTLCIEKQNEYTKRGAKDSTSRKMNLLLLPRT